MKKYWEENRRRYIFELRNIPPDIKFYQRLNKKLTKIEKMVSAILQECASLGWISDIKTQQIIKLGDLEKYIIVDFFVVNPGFIVEVDGPEHSERRDAYRDKLIKKLFNYKVLRVSNFHVLEYNNEVRESLLVQICGVNKMKPRDICARVREYWRLKDRGLI